MCSSRPTHLRTVLVLRVLSLEPLDEKPMPGTPGDFAVSAAPGGFVLLCASGFVFTKLGFSYAEAFTFQSLRIAAVVALLGITIVVTRPKWPDWPVWGTEPRPASCCMVSISAACSFRLRTGSRQVWPR